MNKILSGLKDLLSSSFNDQFAEPTPNQDVFLERLNLECRSVEANIQHKFLGFEGDKPECIKLIYYLQREMLLLGNGLTHKIPAYGFLNSVLGHLIDFLRQEYTPYLNQNEGIPDSYRESKIKSSVIVTDKLKNWLGGGAEYEVLIEIIEDYLQQNGHVINTYGQMNYYLIFVQRLEVLISQKSPRPVQVRLIKQLYYLNFNAHAFISYCSDIFAKHADGNQLLSPVDMESYDCLKKLGLSTQHDNLGYDLTDKTLRIVIKELTSFELEYQKELSENKFRMENQKPLIVAHMTVTVLVVLAEAAKAAKSFTTVFNNNLYTFISNNVTTMNHKGRLSAGAMKNRKNEADNRSAMEAIRHLENIKEEIRKKFFLK